MSSRYLVVITGIALVGMASTAQPQQLDIGGVTARLAAAAAARVRDQLAEAEREQGGVVLQPDDSRRQAAFAQQRARIVASAASSYVRASGSVSAAARCADGYVSSGEYRTTAPDVQIVRQGQLDCDGRGCHAFQVDARRESEVPFDLEVSVVCTGV